MSAIPRRTSQDFSNLVGVPYEEMNCWDLTHKFYAQVFDIELKHYCHETPVNRNETKNLIYSNKGDFQQVDGNPIFGDIIVLKIHGIESHIAVYVGGGRMLHTVVSSGSIIDRLERWDRLIVGYFRLIEGPTND